MSSFLLGMPGHCTMSPFCTPSCHERPPLRHPQASSSTPGWCSRCTRRHWALSACSLRSACIGRLFYLATCSTNSSNLSLSSPTRRSAGWAQLPSSAVCERPMHLRTAQRSQNEEHISPEGKKEDGRDSHEYSCQVPPTIACRSLAGASRPPTDILSLHMLQEESSHPPCWSSNLPKITKLAQHRSRLAALSSATHCLASIDGRRCWWGWAHPGP